MYFRKFYFSNSIIENDYFIIYQRTPYSKIVFQYDEPLLFETLEDLLDMISFTDFDWLAEAILESDFPDYIKNNFP